MYVRSRRAGERVMRSVTRLLTTKLKLRVNSEKSMEAKIPGVQLHESQASEEVPGAEIGCPVQGESPGTYEADPGHKSGPNGP
jgi:hypothetical protein